MSETILRLNQLADRLQDTKRAASNLYLIGSAVSHSEGTITDYADALTLLYETISEQLSDQQQLISEISRLIKDKEGA